MWYTVLLNDGGVLHVAPRGFADPSAEPRDSPRTQALVVAFDTGGTVGKDCRVSRVRWSWNPAPEDEAFLDQRARTHASYRLAGRAIQMVLAGQTSRPRRTVAAAAAWAVSDLAGAAVLRRSPRFALIPRMIIDLVDVLWWGTKGDDCDLAVITSLPLSIESGIRLGPLALVIPAIGATVTGTVRRKRHLPASTASFRWQVIAVAVGTGFAAYARNRRKVVLARHQQELEARVRQAYVGGQNDVAMGADSVVDLLSRTAPLLPSGSGDQVVGRLLASWKQSLAADTMTQTTYLGVAAAQWQRRHNSAHHALAADVALDLEPGAGTVLLTGVQSRWLESALDSLDLRGRVPVVVVDPDEAAQPTTVRRLLVGDDLLVVPADQARGLTPIDIGPSGFVIGSMWAFDTLSPSNSGSAPWAVGPVVAGGVGLAAWAHRQVDRRGADAHPQILAAGVGMALAQAVAGTATMTRTRANNGLQRYPFIAGVDMLGLLVSIYAEDLEPRHVWGVGLGALGVIGLGLVLMPEPIIWTHLFCELLWSTAAAVAISGLGSGLSAEAIQVNQQLAEVDDAAISQAFSDGRAAVVSMVADAGRRVRQAFEESRSLVLPSMAAEVEQRLDEMSKRLQALGLESGYAPA